MKKTIKAYFWMNSSGQLWLTLGETQYRCAPVAGPSIKTEFGTEMRFDGSFKVTKAVKGH